VSIKDRTSCQCRLKGLKHHGRNQRLVHDGVRSGFLGQNARGALDIRAGNDNTRIVIHLSEFH
jgi:hypothetical protein